MSKKVNKVAFYLPNLGGGGAERSMLNLIREFVKHGFIVDLVLANATGPYLNQVPSEVKIINLRSLHVSKSLPKLTKYLRENKPDVLISSLDHANIVAIIAKLLSFRRTKIIVRVDSTLSQELKNLSTLKGKLIPLLMKVFYRYVDFIVAVSEGVKEDLTSFLKIPKDKVKVIYNPVISSDIFEKAKEPVDHPWFTSGEYPIIIGVGRLNREKDFQTLIKAFSFIRKEVDARLVILGEGEERKNLENLAKELGISEYLLMPGFVNNPYKYMSKSSVFVLSSIYEGLPTVLIEALSLGIPVVSTDCPSGPREILENGKYGKLVPVHNEIALARAIIEVLKNKSKINFDFDFLKKYKSEFVKECYLELIQDEER
ncbi:glycosyltransferase [Caldisericum exile]|uniref:glycosyltransferase n=1 Tax=Caldisericum exile TaxID=693075 RepID=UPI003C76E82C